MSLILQINTVVSASSTGKITEEIGRLAIADGWESWIAYGRGKPQSTSNLIRIGNDFDMMWHGLQTRLFDRHGLASAKATKVFIERIKEIEPDIIHLHNIHGYYINYPILFRYLKEWGGPVVWTLHDCWPFTGHCANFQQSECNRWMSGCHNCNSLIDYPASWHADRSSRNFKQKKAAFSQILPQLTIVTVSDWLKKTVAESFLREAETLTITNGIDLETFRPYEETNEQKTVLGVANVWTDKKGLDDFIFLRKNLPQNYRVILIGLSESQIKKLPTGIEGIGRTSSQQELAKHYSMATVFVNPTKEETFSLTNVEALACGTPVVCYATGGTPETISSDTGTLVPPGNKNELLYAVKKILGSTKIDLSEACRERAVRLFDQRERFAEYIDLYHSLV